MEDKRDKKKTLKNLGLSSSIIQNFIHCPVLQKEVLEKLDPKPNENFIDCTINGGGHAMAILEKIAPKGKILGIELDSDVYKKIKSRLADFSKFNCQIQKRLILVNNSYTNLKKIVENHNFKPVHGILLDLGMSSWHLEKSGRGFTFLKDEVLDMRYDLGNPLNAEKIVNQWPEEKIVRILKEYGEEKFAKRIAKRIVRERERRRIKTTFQLAEIIKKSIPRKKRRKINPATLTFQALRIAVNDELNNLKKVLPQALEILEKNGRIAIISFHSLEDRIVKMFFKKNLQPLTKKPITPSQKEIKINPRCRSAKLRAAIKI